MYTENSMESKAQAPYLSVASILATALTAILMIQTFQSEFKPVLVPDYRWGINPDSDNVIFTKPPGIGFNFKNVGKGVAMNVSIRPMESANHDVIPSTIDESKVSIYIEPGDSKPAIYSFDLSENLSEEMMFLNIMNIFFGDLYGGKYLVEYEDIYSNRYRSYMTLHKQKNGLYSYKISKTQGAARSIFPPNFPY